MTKNDTKWLSRVPERVGWYFAGFVDGEGSFNVSLRKKSDYKIKWQVVLTFNVSQIDITVLALLKRYLGCGRLQQRKDGVHYFVVTNYHAINEYVIPFFERFSFFSSSKKKNFSLFKKIAILVEKGAHLEEEGLKEILDLRERLNEGRGRKRKYYKKDVTFCHKRILRDYMSGSDTSEKR